MLASAAARHSAAATPPHWRPEGRRYCRHSAPRGWRSHQAGRRRVRPRSRPRRPEHQAHLRRARSCASRRRPEGRGVCDARQSRRRIRKFARGAPRAKPRGWFRMLTSTSPPCRRGRIRTAARPHRACVGQFEDCLKKFIEAHYPLTGCMQQRWLRSDFVGARREAFQHSLIDRALAE